MVCTALCPTSTHGLVILDAMMCSLHWLYRSMSGTYCGMVRYSNFGSSNDVVDLLSILFAASNEFKLVPS